MRRARLLWIAVVVLTMVASGCSKGDGRNPPSSEQPAGRGGAVGTGGAGANLKSDSDFVRDVAIKNIGAVELSRMALDKATDPDVKAFAQRFVTDNGAVADKLKSVVSGQAIEWPAQLDDKHRKINDELANKQGSSFDRDYVEAMVEGLQDLAAKLESRLDVQSLADWKTAAAARTHSNTMPEPQTAMRDVQVRPAKSDNDATTKINQWAADTYPLTQKHLDTARTLANSIKKRATN